MEKKQRYFCQICTNKKFKTAHYLEEHIKRRHLNYYQQFPNYQNRNKKSNVEVFEEKLNEMKKYFEILINQSIKKAQYIRLNERLNGLNNLLLMMPNQNLRNNNINYNDNNIGINYNQENTYINQNNFNQTINEEKFKNSNRDFNHQINDREEIKNQKKNEMIFEIKKMKKEMKQFYEKQMKEILEVKNEQKFQNIKKYFENISEDDNSPIHHSRRRNKTKTTKIQKKHDNNILSESKHELNQSADEIKKEDLKESKNNMNANSNDYLTTKNDSLKEMKDENNNNNIYLNNKNQLAQINYREKQEEKDKKISFSESDSQTSENWASLEKFFKNFRKRDGTFSKEQKEDYLRKVIPEDYKINESKINKIIEEKIDQKLRNLKKSTNEDLIEDIIKLYFQILDKNIIYGDVHCYYSRNMSNLMNIKKLVDDANEYYYQKSNVKDIKKILDRSKELNKATFEKVDYQITTPNINNSEGKIYEDEDEEEENEKNNFSFGH